MPGWCVFCAFLRSERNSKRHFGITWILHKRTSWCSYLQLKVIVAQLCRLPSSNGFSNTSNGLIFLRRFYQFEDVLQNGCSKNFLKFHKKTPALESLFLKLQAFSPVTLLKRDSNTGVFVWNFKKTLMTSFLRNSSGSSFWELVYMETLNLLREGRFYGIVGILHKRAYFRCFIAFGKLKFMLTSKVNAIKLKTKTKSFDYFSKSCFQILIFD